MTTENKTTQSNLYVLLSSSGSRTNKVISASNLKEAIKKMKEQYPNDFYFGKVKRIYNGGVRG